MKVQLSGARILIAMGLILLALPWLRPERTETQTAHRNKGGSLVLPTQERISSLDPSRVISAFEKAVLSVTFARLVRLDENLEIQPDLLEKWDYDPRTREFTFSIKPESLFSDGTPIESKDVIYSFHYWAKRDSLDNNLLDPIVGVENYRNGLTKQIAGLREKDSRHLTVRLSKPADDFIQLLTLSRFSIFPENLRGQTAQNFFRRPVASGPFVLTQEFTPGDEQFTFERNPYYFHGEAYLDSITFKYMPMAGAISGLKDGSLTNLIYYENAIPFFTSNIADIPRSIHQIKINSFDVLTLIFNTKAEPILNDPKVRQAIARQVNKTEILRECYGADKHTSTRLLSPGVLGSELTDEPEKHADILEDFNKKLELNLYLSTESNTRCLTDVLGSKLQLTGIKVHQHEYRQLFDLFMHNKLGLWIEALVFKNEDPYSILQYFNQNSPEYLLGKPYPYLQSLYNRLANSHTFEEKAYLYREIESYLRDQNLVIPLVKSPNTVLISNKIEGIEFAGSRYNVVDWKNVGLRD